MLDETYIESLVKKRFSSESKRIFNGIGDDAAVCRIIDNQIVVSCDSHVENVHFNRKNFTPEEISSRSLAIAISDIVAMGAVPRFFLNSLLLPRGTTKKFIDKLFDGFEKTSKKFKISLVGGNVSKSNSLIIDVVVIGELKNHKYKERGKCTNGDFLYVSGNIGDASLGLKILNKRKKRIQTIEQRRLVEKYKHPNPKIKLGKFLGQLNYVSSMIDITDGLLIDLHRLIGSRRKRLGARIVWEDIPKSKEHMTIQNVRGAEENVLRGGDDYELMFTIKRNSYLKFESLVRTKKFKIFKIGEITKDKKIILEIGGKDKILKPGGFTHRF